jgi:hypothetical protein
MIHTHSISISTLYLYKVFQHLLLWLVVIRMQFQPDICSLGPVAGCHCVWLSKLDSLLVVMIETPHTLHTHSRSTLYMYKVFQHLLQWLLVLVVIRMSPQADVYLSPHSAGVVTRRITWLLTCMSCWDWYPHFIMIHSHSRSSLYIYIYIAIQHLIVCLQIIMMLPHPDIYPLGLESGCCWYRRWVTVSTYDWYPPSSSYS